MKFLFLFAAIAACSNLFAQANTKLSNLSSPTAINVTLLPRTTANKDLGSSSFQWRNLSLSGSIFKGSKRFLSNAGVGNTFLGLASGVSLTYGSGNTAIGDSALYA